MSGLTPGGLEAQEPEAPPEPPPSEEEVRARTQARLDSLNTAQEGTPEDRALRLERIRSMYVLSVSQEKLIDQALDEVASLRESAVGPEDPVVAVAEAYAGALKVVRGKHAFWPRGKWNHVQDGLDVLDALVELHPDEPEVRYLRLVSCYYLPFFFRRGGTVDTDLRDLLELLPKGPGVLSAHAYPLVVDFVVEASGKRFSGDDHADARALRSALVEAVESGGLDSPEP